MTFTIVARDAVSGALGVAAETRYFAVGETVPWARPGIGAVATQALTEPAHGPRVLDLLTSGASATEALAAVLAVDPAPELRQVGVVDTAGRVAAHTGSRCIRYAEHLIEADHVTMANLGSEPGIPAAMSRAFAASSGSLARRMLAALQAGDAAGGDLRGRQSASLLVVSGNAEDPPWSSLVDVRVDDHDEPIGEIARLLHLQEAYGRLSRGLNHLFVGHVEEARAEIDAALRLVPDNPQVRFWCGLARELATGSRIEPESDPRWGELRRRLEEVGLFAAAIRRPPGRRIPPPG